MTEDLSHWPLVIGCYRHAPDLAAYQAQLERWHGWLMQPTPFVWLRIYATPDALAQPEGSAALGKAWLAERRALFQRQVAAMATVVLPPQAYARLKNLQVQKAFGVPGQVHASVPEALDWLRQQVFTPRGWPMPTQADVMAAVGL